VGVGHYTNNSKYQGEWANRYPDGRGSMKTYSDGTVMTLGLWKKGKPVDENGNLLEEYVARKKKNVRTTAPTFNRGAFGGLSERSRYIRLPGRQQVRRQFPERQVRREKAPSILPTVMFIPADSGKTIRMAREHAYSGTVPAKVATGVRANFWDKVWWKWARPDVLKATVTDQAFSFTRKVLRSIPDNSRRGCRGTEPGDMPTAMLSRKLDRRRIQARYPHLRDKTEVDGYWKAGAYMGRECPTDTSVTEKCNLSRCLFQIVAPGAKVWAVVCGVATYDHMPVLRYTDDDALPGFYAFLKSPEGGALPDQQIRALIDEDATHENILENIDQIFGMAGPDDLVVFYFSGHGLNGSFLPIDFDGTTTNCCTRKLQPHSARQRRDSNFV
jgi:hypothetical protein